MSFIDISILINWLYDINIYSQAAILFIGGTSMKKYQNLLELCAHLSYDALSVIDPCEISSDKMYAIQTRLTQLLILVASSFLIKMVMYQQHIS